MFEDALAGGGVPLAGRTKAGVEIAGAGGQGAEFERAAGLDEGYGSGQARNEGFGFGRIMRPAGEDAQRFAVPVEMRFEREGCAVFVMTPSAETFSCDIGGADGGGVNGCCDRAAVFDQRDIDGELAIAADEFAGAIERIDEEEQSGVARQGVGAFLGEDGNVGEMFGEARADDGVGGKIGLGDGGLIGFRGDGDGVFFIDFHDGGTGLEREGAEKSEICVCGTHA